ncbi:MAG: hypothetical protein J7480_09015 [Microbacteriaceae bacterium]|nr:hypothetical protein [Microbacteriaceae bacterium]
MTTTTAPVPTAPRSAPAAAPAMPSIHVRAFITWLAIFPLVTIAFLVTGTFTEGWHPVLRVFVMTLLIVPTAVYVVVPQLMRLYGRIRSRRR